MTAPFCARADRVDRAPRPYQRGLTLIEVLVATSLGLLAIILALSLLMPALRSWRTSLAQSSAHQDLLIVASRVGQDVRLSLPRSLVAPYPGVLSMQWIPSLDVDPRLNPHPQVSYWLQHGHLYRQSRVLTGSEAKDINFLIGNLPIATDRRLILKDLASFSASVPHPWLVHLDLELKRPPYQARITTTFTTRYAPIDLHYAEKAKD